MILLTIIYLAFISLGLPDAVLGAAWPTISQDTGASLEQAGIIAMIVNLGTVISSLSATRVIHRVGTGNVVMISVLFTAAALLGFATANYLFVMAMLAIPLGLGAGAVDAALNNFVALHYKARHMNYLHSCWGIGATAGPVVMAMFLMSREGWRDGYLTLSVIQFVLVIVLIVTLPFWKKAASTEDIHNEENTGTALISNREALAIKGVKFQLVLFWCYCSLEAGTGLWAASYLTLQKGITVSEAAFWTAMFFFGITAGRVLCGLLAERIGEERLVYGGAVLMLIGVAGLMLPMPILYNQLSLVLVGLGCAPIYPNTIHLTPARFGKQPSQAIIGLSMATAYIGTTTVPPLMGVVIDAFSFSVFPVLLLLLGIALLMMVMRLQKERKNSALNLQFNSLQQPR